MKNNQEYIAAIRSFNRFYTDLIGLLEKHLLNSNYSLAEVRVLYEIYTAGSIQASQIMVIMHIDKSYLSRLLKRLEKDKLLDKNPAEHDARASLISLTEKGISLFKELNEASNHQIKGLIQHLDPGQQTALVTHMDAIKTILQST